jgi:hypothetical protein
MRHWKLPDAMTQQGITPSRTVLACQFAQPDQFDNEATDKLVGGFPGAMEHHSALLLIRLVLVCLLFSLVWAWRIWELSRIGRHLSRLWEGLTGSRASLLDSVALCESCGSATEHIQTRA